MNATPIDGADNRETLVGWSLALWAALADDPAAAIGVVGTDGRVHFANRALRRLFLGPKADREARCPGNLDHLASDVLARECRRLLDASMPAGMIVRCIIDGREIVASLRPVGADESARATDTRLLLVIARPTVIEASEASRDAPPVALDCIGLGSLDVLTARELEVLALIGRGLASKVAAAELGLSPKTVENHRQSIGRKLGVDNRVELARLARRAGLTVADATRRRMPAAL